MRVYVQLRVEGLFCPQVACLYGCLRATEVLTLTNWLNHLSAATLQSRGCHGVLMIVRDYP